ncbi:hypothetical protein CVT24_008560 [Panaeolus cyanescens]|uniref:F-box domain-containing protein n=1 Tax=Panaeolus cyanescens TaxID=181874 RepID=A0A409VDP6_9AGAR|nr:hypothetical protein CVT24_008560 [Panaeolus cyanescens]
MSSPLPLEIFPIVFEHADDDDLFNIAAVSRTFNNLAFQTYFLRHEETPRPSLQVIDLQSSLLPSSYLQALVSCLEFRGRNVDGLIYRYDPHRDWRVALCQVKLLTRLLNTLGQIKRLELTLLLPFSRTRGLGRANAELLKAVNEKQCVHLDVSGRFTIYYRSLFAKSERKHHPDFGEFLPLLWAKQCLRIQSQNDEGSPSSKLNHMVVRYFPLTFRQYYFDALRGSKDTLTALDFINIPSYATKDFSILLSDVTFPNLQTFCLTSCKRVHQAAIVSFLARHPGLTFLRYLLVDYSSNSKIVAPIPEILSSSFKKVMRLETSPQYILRLLPPLSQFPVLNKITIYTSVGSDIKLAKDLDTALASLQACRSDVDLTILSPCYENGLEQWVTRSLDIEDNTRPETHLHCVRSLTLEHQRAGFRDTMLELLPAWCALFPNLHKIHLKGFTKKPHYAIPLQAQRLARVRKELSRLCPSVHTFTVEPGYY